MHPATLKFYVHHAMFSDAITAHMLFLKGLGMPSKQSPSCAPECLHADSNSTCKISRNLTPAYISAGT